MEEDKINNIANISHIYCICDPIKEKDRFQFISEWLNLFDKSYYTIKSYCYKDTITTKDLLDYSLSRTRLRKSESSLMINYFKIMEEIELKYKSGNFLILESDVIPMNNWEFLLNEFMKKTEAIDFDFVHIGNGCNLMPMMYGHKLKAKPDIYLCPKARCTESIIWSYNGIKKFNKARKEYDLLIQPLDFHFDEIIEKENSKIYWSYPSVFAQGSQNGKYMSAIQHDENPREK